MFNLATRKHCDDIKNELSFFYWFETMVLISSWAFKKSKLTKIWCTRKLVVHRAGNKNLEPYKHGLTLHRVIACRNRWHRNTRFLWNRLYCHADHLPVPRTKFWQNLNAISAFIALGISGWDSVRKIYFWDYSCHYRNLVIGSISFTIFVCCYSSSVGYVTPNDFPGDL